MSFFAISKRAAGYCVEPYKTHQTIGTTSFRTAHLTFLLLVLTIRNHCPKTSPNDQHSLPRINDIIMVLVVKVLLQPLSFEAAGNLHFVVCTCLILLLCEGNNNAGLMKSKSS